MAVEAGDEARVRPDLEERVAALETALNVPGICPEAWTDEQVTEFRERFAESVDRHEMRLIPSPPPLTPDQVRQLLRECVTVVKPGETLILRCPEGWTPEQAGEMQQHAAWWLAEHAPDIRVLVVPHLEMAVMEADRSEGERRLG
jgi:hypothetical protein